MLCTSLLLPGAFQGFLESVTGSLVWALDALSFGGFSEASAGFDFNAAATLGVKSLKDMFSIL